MIVLLTDEQKVTLHVAGVTAGGNPAPLGNAPTWTATDPALLTLNVSVDGLTCEAVTVGPAGTCTINCEALSVDGSIVSGSIDISVVPAQAASLLITADAPVLK